MKYNFGFEYSEEDYKNLCQSTTTVLVQLLSVASEGISTMKEIQLQSQKDAHEAEIRKIDKERSEIEEELEDINKVLNFHKIELKRLRRRIPDPNINLGFEDDFGEDDE